MFSSFGRRMPRASLKLCPETSPTSVSRHRLFIIKANPYPSSNTEATCLKGKMLVRSLPRIPLFPCWTIGLQEWMHHDNANNLYINTCVVLHRLCLHSCCTSHYRNDKMQWNSISYRANWFLTHPKAGMQSEKLVLPIRVRCQGLRHWF